MALWRLLLSCCLQDDENKTSSSTALLTGFLISPIAIAVEGFVEVLRDTDWN